MIKIYDMLEAFFTRQRQRNVAVILSAMACMIWIGHFQTAAPSANQASQTSDPTVAETSDAPQTQQSYKRAEPVVDEPVNAQSNQLTEQTSSPSASGSAPTVTLSNQRIERTELSNGVVYDLYYKINTTGNIGTPMVKTTLTGNRSCAEATVQSYRYTDASEQVIRCTLTAADSSLDTANTAQFKLEIVVDSVPTTQVVTYTWTPAPTVKP